MLVVGASASSVLAKSKVEQGTPVDIGIKCGGLDLENLDLISTIVLGQVLEESYSQVIKNSSSDSFVKVDATRRRGGWRPSWRCGSLCPDDDAVVERNLNNQEGFTLNGLWNCGSGDNCAEDNHAMLDLILRSGGLRGATKGASGIVDMSAWEKAFVNAMIQTRRSAFSSIGECSINVKSSTNFEKSS